MVVHTWRVSAYAIALSDLRGFNPVIAAQFEYSLRERRGRLNEAITRYKNDFTQRVAEAAREGGYANPEAMARQLAIRGAAIHLVDPIQMVPKLLADNPAGHRRRANYGRMLELSGQGVMTAITVSTLQPVGCSAFRRC